MLKQHEWDSVLDNIRSGNTIICLGAEIFAATGQEIDRQIEQCLVGLENVHMYSDGLFHFRGSGDMTSFTRIKQFYLRDVPALDDIYDKLAVLPIPVFINTNQDRLLHKAFQRLRLPCQYSFHHPRKSAAELTKSTINEPLIYNLLGDIEDRESMLLTHEDLFMFLESIMKGESVSRVLKEQINASYSIIFIGLPFDKWYMKVLLHFLQKDANKKALKFAANQAFDADVQSFVIDEFKITCVPVRIVDFVDELHQRCTAANLLKSAESGSKTTSYQRWTQMALQDELGNLLEDLMALFTQARPQDVDNQNQLFYMTGRLAGLERMIAKGTIANDDALLQRNQIRESLFQFLNENVRPLNL